MRMSLKRDPASAPVVPDFLEIFETQFSYVWHVLKRLGVAERDLEDLAQQVFLQVHGQLSKFATTRPLRPWLFSFAYHAASNYRALSRHRVELSIVAPEQVDTAAGADEQLITRQELELAELALSRVALDRRALLLLHEVEGHSVPEIADSLRAPLRAPRRLLIDGSELYYIYETGYYEYALSSCSLPACAPSIPLLERLNTPEVIAMDDQYLYTADTEQDYIPSHSKLEIIVKIRRLPKPDRSSP